MSHVFDFSTATRSKRSPYWAATVADGVRAMQPYNNMLMPAGYGDPEAEYWRIINGVSMWDVAVERQIELNGPDAMHLAQILSPRDLSKCKEGQGKYVALCNHAGTLINDPILLKLSETRVWLSIADSNILFWARAIAAERGLNVNIFEADVSPLAVQGPKAEAVVASIFGGWVRNLKYFWFRETSIQGIPVQVARSGWSKQGGFEIYLMDGSRAVELWNIVKEAGQPLGIGPGNPNLCERIESGLLSYGADSDDTTNPFELRLGRYVDLDVSDDVIGIHALRKIWADGPIRHQLGVVLDEPKGTPHHEEWYDISVEGRKIGDMTNGVWSYRMETFIGFALVSRALQPGDTVNVQKVGREVTGTLVDLPFL